MSLRVDPIRLRRAVAATLLVALPATLVGCNGGSGDRDDTGETSRRTPPTLPVDTPSRAELSEVTGLAFPASTADYRSVQLGPGQLDVLATIAASDIEAFIDDSDLPVLQEGGRTIAHPSPLWELNPIEPLSGTGTERDGMSIAIEVVGEGDPRTVRVSIIATGD